MLRVERNSGIKLHRHGPVFLDQEGMWWNFIFSTVGWELRKPTLLLEASSSEIVSNEDADILVVTLFHRPESNLHVLAVCSHVRQPTDVWRGNDSPLYWSKAFPKFRMSKPLIWSLQRWSLKIRRCCSFLPYMCVSNRELLFSDCRSYGMHLTRIAASCLLPIGSWPLSS